MKSPTKTKVFLGFAVCLLTLSVQAQLRDLDGPAIEKTLQSLEHQPYTQGAKVKKAATVISPKRYIVDLPVQAKDSAETQNVQVPLYLPKNSSGRDFPIVVISSTIEGQTVLEKYLAKKLNDEGLGVAILDVNSFAYKTGQEGNKEIYKNSVSAIHAFRTVVDWVESNPEIPGHEFKDKKHPIAALGLSNGTLTVTSALSVEPRVEAAVIVGAVGDIPHIYAYSTHKKIAAFRKSTAAAENLKPEEVEKYFAAQFPADPVHVAPFVNSDIVYQIIATDDVTVPTADQLKIWQSLNKPDSKQIPKGHKAVILSTAGSEFAEIIAFMRSQLPNTCPPQVKEPLLIRVGNDLVLRSARQQMKVTNTKDQGQAYALMLLFYELRETKNPDGSRGNCRFVSVNTSDKKFSYLLGDSKLRQTWAFQIAQNKFGYKNTLEIVKAIEAGTSLEDLLKKHAATDKGHKDTLTFLAPPAGKAPLAAPSLVKATK